MNSAQHRNTLFQAQLTENSLIKQIFVRVLMPYHCTHTGGRFFHTVRASPSAQSIDRGDWESDLVA